MEQKKNKELNYGICFFRIIAVFFVVCFHFHANWDYYPRSYVFLRELTVPIFLITAFYFSEHIIENGTAHQKLDRIKRLFIPYFFWGLFGFAFTYVIEHHLGIEDGCTLNDLKWQLLLGCVEKIDPPLYFLWMVMFFSLFFYLVFFLFGKKMSAGILAIMAFVCLWIQYDGRLTFFFKTLPYVIMYGIGRIYELIPFAIFGVLIAIIPIIEFLKRHRAFWCVILSIIVPLMVYFREQWFPRSKETLAFSGCALFIVAPIMFLWLYILPFEILPKAVKKVLKVMSDYTLGLFAMHWPLGKIFNIYYEQWTGTKNTLTECFIIFVICWVLAFLIGHIPGKFSKMLVR